MRQRAFAALAAAVLMSAVLPFAGGASVAAGPQRNVTVLAEWGTATYSDDAVGVAVASSGDVYVAYDAYTSTTDYPAVRKYSATGELLWTASDLTAYEGDAKGVATDDAGNAYVVGTVVKDATNHAFLAKVSPAGTVLWRDVTTGVYDFAYGYAVAVDPSTGTAYLAGETNDWATEAEETLVTRYDSSGDLVWTRTLATASPSDWNIGLAIALDATGTRLAVGGQTGGVFTDYETTPAGQTDNYVATLAASDGTVGWIDGWGTVGIDPGVAGVAFDSSGRIDAVASYGSNQGSAHVRQWSSSATADWTTGLVGIASIAEPKGIAIGPDDSILVAGVGQATAGVGARQAYVWTVGADGTLGWSEGFDSGTQTSANGIAATAGGMYLAGQTFGVFAGFTNAGVGDAYLARLATPSAAYFCAPTLTGVTPDASGSVGLTWTSYSAYCEGGGSHVDGYNVYVGTSPGGEDYANPVATTTLLSTTVTDLSPGTTYYFTVTQVWESGESAASNEDAAIPFRAPAAPTVTSAVAGDHEVALAWTPPSDTGGLMLKSYYYYLATLPAGGSCPSALDTDTDGPHPLTTDPDATSGTIGSLANATTYCVSIFVTNTADLNSPQSAVSTVTPLGTPSERTLSITSVGNGTLGLAWTKAGDDGGSPVTGYSIYVGTSSGTETKTSDSPLALTSLASDDFHYYTSLSGLPTDGTPTYVYVRAVNEAGEGAASNEQWAVTALAPEPPTSVDATTGTVTRKTMSPRITWVDDSSATGIDNHFVYVYTWKKGNTKNPTGTYTELTTFETSSGTSVYTIPSLSTRYTYAFKVSAHAPGGWSGVSAYSNRIP